MTDQERLRIRVKLAKVYNQDIYYKDFADYIDISINSFYNWLNGYYNLGSDKYKKLKSVIDDLLD